MAPSSEPPRPGGGKSPAGQWTHPEVRVVVPGRRRRDGPGACRRCDRTDSDARPAARWCSAVLPSSRLRTAVAGIARARARRARRIGSSGSGSGRRTGSCRRRSTPQTCRRVAIVGSKFWPAANAARTVAMVVAAEDTVGDTLSALGADGHTAATQLSEHGLGRDAEARGEALGRELHLDVEENRAVDLRKPAVKGRSTSCTPPHAWHSTSMLVSIPQSTSSHASSSAVRSASSTSSRNLRRSRSATFSISTMRSATASRSRLSRPWRRSVGPAHHRHAVERLPLLRHRADGRCDERTERR